MFSGLLTLVKVLARPASRVAGSTATLIDVWLLWLTGAILHDALKFTPFKCLQLKRHCHAVVILCVRMFSGHFITNSPLCYSTASCSVCMEGCVQMPADPIHALLKQPQCILSPSSPGPSQSPFCDSHTSAQNPEMLHAACSNLFT